MKYSDIQIGSLDQQFIDDMSEKYDVDYRDAEIYPGHGPIANHIINHILSQAVYNLDTTERVKDYLIDSIFCNCFDSFYNTNEDTINELDRTDEEKQIAIEHIQ